MLGTGQGFGHQTAMFDQWWTKVRAFERGIDVGHVLARDHDIVGCHLAGEIGDGVFEREGVRHRIDVDAQCTQLLVRLFRHARLAEAGHDVDAVSLRVEGLGKEPDLGFLATDHEPGKDEEDACRFGLQSATLKTICMNSGRLSTSSERKAGPSLKGTTWVITSRRTTSPTDCRRAMVSPASRRRSH